MQRTEILQNFTKKTLGLTFALSAAALAFAQEKKQVTGSIVDKNNTAIPYASVTFVNTTNKLFSDAALTDERGHYSIQLVPGNYEIAIEAIDFKKSSLTKQLNGGNIGALSLERESSATLTKTKNIEGVTITATSKPYKVELDKKTYDPSTDLISKGGNLQDVLSNVPSVSVETDGTISMRGSSNVKFLINGKPSALLGIDDGANALQSIPADQIERIEVISNPSSKFEASGTAGILNIILKKNKKTGFNGSVTGTLGYQPQTSLNANLGWRRNNLTWFLNGGGGYRESEGKNTNDTWYKNVTEAGKLLETHQNSISKNKGENYNASTGFVYDFNDRTSVNASGTVRTFESENTGNTDINELKLNASPYISNRNETGRGNNLAFQGDFGLDHKFDDKGQNISLSFSLQRNRSNNYSNLLETSNSIFDSNDMTAQHSLNKSMVGKADYELPIGENSKLEAGYRFDQNKNNYNNDIKHSSVDAPLLVNLPLYTNTTDYKEIFNAFYAQFKSKIGNFGYQLGLRDELTKVDINYFNLANEKIDKVKSYNNLFPSVYLSYDVTKDNQILLNYSRRIDRPRSFFMVPYARYSNPRSVFEGNIDLDPSYVNSYELGYSIQKKKLTLNPTLYYRYTTDDTKMLTYRRNENENTIYTKPLNLGTEAHYGLDLNFSYDAFSWWRLMGSVDLFGYNSKGVAEYEAYDRNNILQNRTRDFAGKGFSTRARLNSTFKIDKTFNIQLQGFFRGGEKTSTQETKSMYALNLGASKTLWKGDGTLAFNIQDIFDTRNRTVSSYNEDFDSKMYMQWMPRQFSVSLTYRFKQGEKIQQPKRKKDINANAQGGDDTPPM